MLGKFAYSSLLHLLVLGGSQATCPAAALEPGLTVENLRCEYRADVPVIDVAAPRLSWELKSPARAQKQNAYQILVAASRHALEADQGDVWDSGRVVSAEQNQIEYGGPPLASAHDYFYKVRVWDGANQAGPWSAVNSWSMGLLDPRDWKAQWIGRQIGQPWGGARWVWTPSSQIASPQTPVVVRKVFQVPGDFKVASARLYLSSYGPYLYSVNGKENGTSEGAVADKVGPDRTLAHYDVAGAIVSGTNTLSVEVTGTSGRSYVPTHGPKTGTPVGPTQGVLAWLEVTGIDHREIIVKSDDTWSATVAPSDDWRDPANPGVNARPATASAHLGGYILGDNLPEVEHPAREFRKEFTAQAKPLRAIVRLTGTGWVEMSINGQRIGRDVLAPDETESAKHMQYLTYDVTDAIQAGANVIGVTGARGRGTDSPAILAQLQIDYPDGSSQLVATDETWKFSTDGAVRSASLYDGERYDARREDGWQRVGYDDAKWMPVDVLPGPGGKLVPMMNEPIRVTQLLPALKMTEPAPGHYIFDFGQNIAGWCRLKVQGPAGTMVTLRHGEALLPGSGELWIQNLQGASALDTYTLSGRGHEVFEPRLTYHGFRYAELTGYPGRPKLSDIEACVVHDDVRQVGDFSCSNQLLTQLFHNMRWGIVDNYHGIPTDCPQRGERYGWTGDRTFEQQNEPWIFDVAAFYTKWFQDIRDSQGADGALPVVAPESPTETNFGETTWTSAATTIPGRLLDHYNDRRVLAATYPAMQKWDEGINRKIENDVVPMDRFGDWGYVHQDAGGGPDQNKTTGALMSTAAYVNDMRLMSRYAKVLGLPQDIPADNAMASRLTAGFNRAFYKSDLAQYDNGTETSFILPLAFNMVPPDHRDAVVKSFLQCLSRHDEHIYCGVVGVGSIMHVLTSVGQPQLAFTVTTQTTYPSWGQMVVDGATTFWEFWDGTVAPTNRVISFNHVMLMGDLGDWMFEDVAGIHPDPDQPGFGHFVIHPESTVGLVSARADYDSIRGPIHCAWKKADGMFTLDVTIPPNTTATVFMPASDSRAVTESGHSASAAEGVKMVRSEKDSAVFEVSSGIYSFHSRLPQGGNE